MIKDRNSKDLTEAEGIKKTWQEYTEELYEKDLNDLDNYDDVVIHQELDILECEVKWALGSITMNKASGGDRNPGELLKILKKNDAVKVLHSICQQICKSQWPQDWKRCVHSNPKEEQCQRMFNYCTTVLISHAIKILLQILQARLQQNANRELPDIQLDLKKVEEAELTLPTFGES